MTGSRHKAGFTLLETILSLALMALIIGMMATLARQWLLNWNRGADRIEQVEAIALAETRMAEDISHSLAFPFLPTQPQPRFIGFPDRIYFLKMPSASDGTDRLIVTLYQSNSEDGISRRIALYNPLVPLEAQSFAAPVSLLPAPYRFELSYGDREGRLEPNWQKRFLPDHVQVEIQIPNRSERAKTEITLLAPTPFICARLPSYRECQAAIENGKTQPGAQTKPGANPNKPRIPSGPLMP